MKRGGLLCLVSLRWVDILQLILWGWHTCQCCFSLWLFYFTFIGLLLLIFFLIGGGCFREDRRKEMRGRMIPVIASGTPVTVWQCLLIKPVLLFKVRVTRACNMQLGKQTDISPADKHMLKRSERRRLSGIPHECKHAGWCGGRVCLHMCVSTRAHNERLGTARARARAAMRSCKTHCSECHLIGNASDLEG